MRRALLMMVAISLISTNDAVGQYKKGKTHITIAGNISHWGWTDNEWTIKPSFTYYVVDNFGIGMRLSYYGRNLFSGIAIQSLLVEHYIRYHLPWMRMLYITPGVVFGFNSAGYSKYFRGGIGVSVPLHPKFLFTTDLNLYTPLASIKKFGTSTTVSSVIGFTFIIN